MFLKNTASQFLYFTMISSVDGSAITSAVAGYRTIDGGSQNAVTGSLSHKGNGQWQLALSQADTNGNNIGFLFTHATGINVSIHINTTVKTIDTLQDISAANVRTQCDDALSAYGPNTVVPNTVVPDAAGTAAALHDITDGKIDALVVPDAAGTAAALHDITDGKIDALVVPDAAGTAAALHGITDGKIDALVVPDAAGTAAALHGITDGKIDAAQSDLDTITDIGVNVVSKNNIDFSALEKASLNASTPSVEGKEMALADNAITSSKFDRLTAFPVASEDSGDTRIARTGADGDTLKTLSDQLDTSGAIAGAGAITFVYTLTSSVTGLPIADADIWATSDEAGVHILASGKTNQYGKVTFYLDAGTIYIWRQKTGWDFINPDTEIVA